MKRVRPFPTGAITVVSTGPPRPPPVPTGPMPVARRPDALMPSGLEGPLPSGLEAPPPRGPEAALAAWLPPMFILLAAAPAAAGGLDGLMELVQDAGLSGLAVAGAAGLGTICAALLLYASGRGVRVPVALVLLVAALPWAAALAGSFGVVFGPFHDFREAVRHAAPEMRPSLVAAALAEVLGARVLGTLAATALVGATAFGLAIAAVGRRGEGRRDGAWVVGFLAALPVLVAVLGLGGLAVARKILPATAAVLPLVALGGVLVLAMAAAAAGRDVPHARSAALAAAAPVALGLALLAAAAMATAAGTTAAFGALAMVDRGESLALSVEAGWEIAPLAVLARYGWAVAAVPVVVVGAWAVVRGRASAGRVLGAAAALALAAGLVLADQLGVEIVAGEIAAANAPPWADVGGFEPLPLGRGGDALDDVDAHVLPDRVVPRAGTDVEIGKAGAKDAAALKASFRELLSTAKRAADGGADAARAGGPRDGGSAGTAGDPSAVAKAPWLVLAVDRRVSGTALKQVLAAAGAAGARAVHLVGELAGEVDEGDRAALRMRLPLLAAWGAPVAAVRVLLEPALAPGYADADVHLLHATVEERAGVEVRARASDPIEPVALGSGAAAPKAGAIDGVVHAGEPAIVYLALGAGASAGSLAEAAELIEAARLRPLVVTGPLPGHPEGPASLPAGTGGGLGGGGLGKHSSGGPAEVSGGLHEDVISRVIRARATPIELCYEKALVRSPKLAGRIAVAFTIAPSGKVKKARVAESTMASAAVEKCVAKAVGDLVFPKPEKGPVEVTYPFVFGPSG